MGKRRMSSVVVACAGWALAACAADAWAVEQAVEFVVEDDSQEPCAGTESHLERFVERAFELLGARPPGDFRVPVWVVREEDFPCEGAGCYRSGEREVYVRDLDWKGYRASSVLRHELAHAVIDRAWGQSAPFFEEGLAESLSATERWSEDRDGERVPVREMLGLPSRELDYGAAARFVHHLIDTRGIERFAELFRGALGRTGPEIVALMERVYGESFAALEAEYRSGGSRCGFQIDVCDPATAELVEGDYRASVAASCEDPGSYGSASEEYEVNATQRTIEIVTGGTYRVRGRYVERPGDAGAFRGQIAMVRCGSCDEQVVHELGPVEEVVALAAGMYTFELTMPFDTVVTIDLERVEAP